MCFGRVEFLRQERAGATPIARDGTFGDALQLCDIGHVESAEDAPFDELSAARIDFGQLRQRAVQRDDVDEIDAIIGDELGGARGQRDLPAASAHAAASRLVDQDLTHRARGQREKLRALDARQIRRLMKFQVRLVHERCRVQRRFIAVRTSLSPRQSAQFFVDESEEMGGRGSRGIVGRDATGLHGLLEFKRSKRL